MKIVLTETEFSCSWEGDGMRRGDNIRTHTWLGQRVTITLDGTDDAFLLQAVQEYDKTQPLEITIQEVEGDLLDRAAHLAWVAAWEPYYKQAQPGGWYVATTYAPDDRPEVYDDGGNYLFIVPRSAQPGDFTTLKGLVREAMEEME